jgi:hypothetical protein
MFDALNSVAGITLSSETSRQLSPDTIIDAQGWFRQCEANPGRFRLRFFSQKPEQGKMEGEIYSGD